MFLKQFSSNPVNSDCSVVTFTQLPGVVAAAQNNVGP